MRGWGDVCMNGNSKVEIMLSEDELEKLLDSKEDARENAEKCGKDYRWIAEASVNYFNIDDNELSISLETELGNFRLSRIELEFKDFLTAVQYVHKKLGKMKTVLEGLK